MNSPLEFRVWHKPTKSLHLVNSFMLDQGDVWVQPPDGASEFEQDYACDNPFKLEDCIMMQFTGCIDKRGQKVWEGDVLRLDNMWIGEVPEGEEEYSEYSYVAFHKAGFANFPLCYERTEEDIKDLIRADLFYLTSLIEGECLPMQRVACMHHHPELLEFTKLYPLYPDAIRSHEQDVSESTIGVSGVPYPKPESVLC